jgi:Heavy metal binding domain
MNAAPVYVCPMHSDVRQQGAGKCPRCRMDLVSEGTKFAILRHMASKPVHIAVMVALMLVLMVLAMMLMK